ncbi:gene transfer agent family protein [Hoeflea sp. CAU 1731]
MTPLVRFFGEGDQNFALTPETILELERVTDSGIGVLCWRLFKSQFGLADIQHTLRLSLIGGGKDPKQAAELVNAYVGMRPLEESLALAVDVLHQLYFGKVESNESN